MLNIVNNERAMIDSLFSGRTADGYVQRRMRRRVDFVARGREYSFNIRGLLLVRERLDNGYTWYRPPTEDEELFRTSFDKQKMLDQLSAGYDEKGYIYRRGG